MAKPISVDLRERVSEAVSEGLSRHQAAARFKVSASSAIRWQAQRQASGTVAPARVGGDRRSARIEAEAAFFSPRLRRGLISHWWNTDKAERSWIERRHWQPLAFL